MKIRDIILIVLIIGMIISTTTLVVFAANGINDIKETTSQSSSDELLIISTKNLASVAAGVRNSLDKQLYSQYDQLELWALSPEFQNLALDSRNYTKDELQNIYWPIYKNLQPSTSAYLTTLINDTDLDELIITNKQGYVIASGTEPPAFDLSGESWFVQVTNPLNKGFYASKAYWSEDAGKWVVDIAAQMIYGNDNFIGVIKGTLDYTTFMGHFFTAAGIDCYEIKAVNGSGLIVGTSLGNKAKVDNPEYIIKDYQYFKDAASRYLRVGAENPVAYEDENGEMVYAEIARSSVQAETTIVASELSTYIDEPVNNFVNGLRDAITQKANSVRTTMIIIGVVVAIIIIVAAYLVIRARITVPLKKLTAVSDKLSQGEIEGLSIDIKGKDEISTFGESFKGVLAAFNFLKEEAEKKS